MEYSDSTKRGPNDEGDIESRIPMVYSKLAQVEDGDQGSTSGRHSPPVSTSIKRWSTPSVFALSALAVGLYLLMRDVYMVAEVRDRAARHVQLPEHSVSSVKEVTGHSIKTLLEDQSILFVFDPWAEILERCTNFAHKAKWLSANMVTGTHFLLGLFSGWLVNKDRASLRRIAVAIFLFRSVLDSYDGAVARLRRSEIAQAGGKGSGEFWSLGYYLDGVADGAATLVFVFGVVFFQFRNPSKTDVEWCRVRAGKLDVPLAAPCRCWLCPSPTVKTTTFFTYFNFGMQLLCCSIFWNTFIVRFTGLLEHSTSSAQLKVQLTVVGWVSFQAVCFAWRSATLFFSGMSTFVFTVFFDKQWEYACATRYVGWVFLLLLAGLTEVFLLQVKHTVMAAR